MKTICILYAVLLTLLFAGCGSQKPEAPKRVTHLNISILLDLSDRVSPSLHPMQAEKDMEIIQSAVEQFKQHLLTKGTFNSLDKIRVLFYPQPENREVLTIAENLEIDFAKLEPTMRKSALRSIDTVFRREISELYNIIHRNNIYPGADIFRFFKDEVNDKSVIADESYRNILIIITDGYLYWKNSLQSSGNRYSYITASSPQLTQFRHSSRWEEEFAKEDYGIIPVNENLNRLEVLLLEFNPESNHPEDFDIMKKYWNKWLLEMNIAPENCKISKTDMPVNTKRIMHNFFRKPQQQ